MRILHVVQRYPPAIGGAEAWCAGLARWQVRAGHDVRVLTLTAVTDDELVGDRPRAIGSFALGRTDVDDGVRVWRYAPSPVGYATIRLLERMGLDVLGWNQSAELYGVLPAVVQRADVVHVHCWWPFMLMTWIVARVYRRRFVVTPFFHAGDPQHESSGASWLLRRADRVVVLTAAEGESLVARGVSRSAIVQASNAIATGTPPAPGTRERVRAALGVPEGAPLVACIGRKAANKGLDVLLEAWARLEGTSALLAVAGPSSDWWDALAPPRADSRLRDLPMLGDADKHDLLAAADLLVLPSKRESFGTVFLEAWAAGTPVLGADIPAVREVLCDGGRTFVADDPADLATQVRALLALSPDERVRLVEAGRRRVARHTWDAVGAAVTTAYGERAAVA